MRSYATLPVVNDDRRIIIDAALYPALSKHSWYIPKGFHNANPRPFTSLPLPSGKLKYVALARCIAGAKGRQFPKHINGNALDCRGENIALMVTRGEAGPDRGLKG